MRPHQWLRAPRVLGELPYDGRRLAFYICVHRKYFLFIALWVFSLIFFMGVEIDLDGAL